MHELLSFTFPSGSWNDSRRSRKILAMFVLVVIFTYAPSKQLLLLLLQAAKVCRQALQIFFAFRRAVTVHPIDCQPLEKDDPVQFRITDRGFEFYCGHERKSSLPRGFLRLGKAPLVKTKWGQQESTSLWLALRWCYRKHPHPFLYPGAYLERYFSLGATCTPMVHRCVYNRIP